MLIKKDHKKVIIDFNGIQFLSPKAANLLIMKNFKRLSKKKDQIEIRNLNQIASGAFNNITTLIGEVEMLDEKITSPEEVNYHP